MTILLDPTGRKMMDTLKRKRLSLKCLGLGIGARKKPIASVRLKTRVPVVHAGLFQALVCSLIDFVSKLVVL